MAVFAPGDTPDGTGYDPASGWPPDDSTGNVWDKDVDLRGYQFGRGGFHLNPRLTGPASGPALGTSLAAPTNAAGMGPRIDPATGQPEMLTGPGGIVEKTRGAMNPLGFIGGGNPYWRGAIAAGGVLTPTPTANDAAPTNMWNQRPSGVGGMPGPQVTNPPQPDHPSTMRYPMWPTPPASAAPADASPMPARPVTPTPTTAAAPPTTAYPAGPAAARQQPNLGAYNPFVTLPYRPNAPAEGGGRGGGGPPVATALDLSRFFGGGAPNVPAPAAQPVSAPPVYRSPSIREVPSGPIDPSIIARQRMKKPKSSSSSQSGGY